MKTLLFALLLVSTAARGDDLEVVRRQFVDYYAARGADASAPRMQDALGALEAITSEITAPGFLLTDGSWSDIDYSGTPDGGWGPWDHSRRLIVMARAYRTPGQKYFDHPALLGQIDAALAYTLRFYGASIYPGGNWWFWTIGIPIDLGPTLVLMRGEVNQRVYDDLVFAMQFRIGNDPSSKGLVGPTPVGQNLVWSCFTHMTLALAKDDAPRFGRVRDAMARVALPATAEGIKADRSFHQHGAQLYTGGYGGQFGSDVARYALITRGTAYAMPAASLEVFASYVADGIAWSLHGTYFDISVIGREVARPTTTGFNGLAALLQASQFPSTRHGEIRAAAAKMLASWDGQFPTEIASLAAQLEKQSPEAFWPSGHRHYFNSDYTIHRRAGWYASVKMFSTRTKSGEKTNGENLFGSRQSDGRLYLSLNGAEYFGRDVLPALDWSRLPGITVEQKPGAADATYGTGTRTLAGGTGDGRNGVSAMDLAPLGSSMTAKKAWFFFDDAIAFLTTDVRSTSGNRVETIVNQWPLRNEGSQLVRRDDWATLEGVGYWFPSSTALQVARETRSGTWARMGGSDDTTVHSKTFVTLWFDHGTSPMNAAAEYVIVPNRTPETMRTWAASRPVSIVANTPFVSAVRDNRSGSLGIAFWAASVSVDGIHASAPAVVYVTKEGRSMRLHAADPNGGTTGTFQITLPGGWVTNDVPSIRRLRSTTLILPRAGGRTTSVSLVPASWKRRAAR